jgi:hypothetical protein
LPYDVERKSGDISEKGPALSEVIKGLKREKRRG